MSLGLLQGQRTQKQLMFSKFIFPVYLLITHFCIHILYQCYQKAGVVCSGLIVFESLQGALETEHYKSEFLPDISKSFSVHQFACLKK